MCGILGGINIKPEKLRKALPLLFHRGPDEKGEFLFNNISLLHVRLSIQDILSGQQPFQHGNLVIIYNGEIYNHLELRKKYHLICNTNSDTETLIRLYEKIGADFLNELDGMFAFAVLDMENRILNIFRDRAGKKPLYYYLKGNIFAFSSELNSLSATGSFSINHNNIFQYLRYGFTGKSTPYQDIFELEAGSYLQISIDTLDYDIKRWWTITDFYKIKNNLNLNENINYLDTLLDRSVFSRLTSSDLEVGTFLSGGIDSGLVTAIASKYSKNLKTFTVSFSGQYDESGLAALVANKYGTDHTYLNISFDKLSNDLEGILSNYGEPFADSSAIPSYYVSREAKKHLTVILNGDGADELFCGYRRYVPYVYYDFFRDRKKVRNLFRLLSSVLIYPRGKMSLYNYFFRLCEFASKPPLLSYLSATFDSYEGYEGVFTSEVNPFRDMEIFLSEINTKDLSGLRKIMCMDFKFNFPDVLLIKMDIATMSNSLEGRSPFLSRDILEFAPTIIDKFKIKGITTKFILRELAKKYLPDEIIHQPKRGFEIPLKAWIENDLKEIVFDYLSGRTFASEFVKQSFILDLLHNKAHVSPEKRAKMLWTLVALEIWYKKCYLNPVLK
jgi:asparagine synthase (glutamine-hydrolysing)